MEFGTFAVEIVMLALQFVTLAIKLDTFAMELDAFALEFITFAEEFVIAKNDRPGTTDVNNSLLSNNSSATPSSVTFTIVLRH